MNAASALPHLDEVRPLDATDGTCLAEIGLILARHGKADRFGIGLLHRHFTLEEGERLVELIDEETRTLTARPVKADELPDAMPSAWKLTAEGPQAIFWCYSGSVRPHP